MILSWNTKLAIQAAIEASIKILEIYHSGDFDITLKGDDSPLTKADIAAHHIIKDALAATNIPLLSEEGKSIPYKERKDWEKLWIVDPIDGTKEFIKRNGEFTVNIALIDNQVPVIGVILAPVLGDLYFSQAGIGAFKVKIDLENFDISKDLLRADKLPIKRKDNTFTVVASRSHMSPETEDYIQDMRAEHGPVSLISKGSSLKLCMVAEGTADCYPRFAPTMEWDTAAGHAICLYAGLNVIDYKTNVDMLYNRKELLNNWFLVK